MGVAPSPSPPINFALDKPTVQSSTSHGGVSSRAVDGNTNGNWRNGSVTHTPNMSNPSWSVDLLSTFTINLIKVYNRQDCCRSRLSGFKVIIWDGSDEAFTYTHAGGTPDMETLVVVPDVDGDRVEIMIPGTRKILSLAEVVVNGE